MLGTDPILTGVSKSLLLLRTGEWGTMAYFVYDWYSSFLKVVSLISTVHNFDLYGWLNLKLCTDPHQLAF